MSTSMDVNSLAQQVKDVTLDAVNTVKEAVVGESAPVDDKHRVFVGNLSAETTEADLKPLFSEIGEIVSVSLPARRNHRSKGTAPSGIAFISFTNDSDAQKAVETLNGKTIAEREITVAIARPLTHSKPKTQVNSEAAAGAETNGTTHAQTNGEKKKRERKPKTTATTTAAKEETTGVAQTNGTTRSAARPPRQRGPPSDGVPSAKTLFVAGIAPKTTNAELKEMFAEHKPVSAHVSLRPIPRYMVKKLAEKGEQRLNRGFGFVSFADSEAQQAALKAMDGHKFGERELAVKVAVDSPELADRATPATTA